MQTHFVPPPVVKSKTKITEEGQACRHCLTPVVKRTHHTPPKYKKGGYYFKSWLACPNKSCKSLYMINSEKRWFDGEHVDSFDFTSTAKFIPKPVSRVPAFTYLPDGPLQTGRAPWEDR